MLYTVGFELNSNCSLRTILEKSLGCGCALKSTVIRMLKFVKCIGIASKCSVLPWQIITLILWYQSTNHKNYSVIISFSTQCNAPFTIDCSCSHFFAPITMFIFTGIFDRNSIRVPEEVVVETLDLTLPRQSIITHTRWCSCFGGRGAWPRPCYGRCTRDAATPWLWPALATIVSPLMLLLIHMLLHLHPSLLGPFPRAWRPPCTISCTAASRCTFISFNLGFVWRC